MEGRPDGVLWLWRRVAQGRWDSQVRWILRGRSGLIIGIFNMFSTWSLSSYPGKRFIFNWYILMISYILSRTCFWLE